MPGPLDDPLSPLSWATAAAAPPAGGAGGEAPGGMGFLPLMLLYGVGIFVLYYFVVGRSQGKRQKQHQDMLSALKKNDRVLTTAGIFGTVVSNDPEAGRVVIRIDDEKGVKMTCAKGSIERVLEAKPAEKERAGAAEKKAAS